MPGSYLNFSELRRGYQNDRRGDYAAQAIQSVGQGVSGMLQKYNKAKEDNMKMIMNPQNDINSITNSIAKSRVSSEYDGFKNKWLDVYKQQKGRLNTQQKIELENDMNAISNQAEYYNQLMKQADQARNTAMKNPYIEFDNSTFDEWVNSMVPDKDGKYDTDKIGSIESKLIRQSTGVPFLKYADLNLDYAINASKPKFDGTKKVSESILITDENGQQKTSEKVVYGYENKEYERNAQIVGNITGNTQEGYNALENTLINSDKYLSEEEKNLAYEKNKGERYPLTAYYFSPKSGKVQWEQPPVVESEKVQPKKESGSGGSSEWETVGELGVGASFRGNPIPMDITYKGKAYKNAHVVGVDYKDKTATVVVPAYAEGDVGEYEDQPKGDITVDIPLKEIYGDLKSASKKRKLKIIGLDEVDLTEKPKIPDFKIAVKTKKNKQGIKVPQPVDLSEDDKEAIKWINENKEDPRSQEIYDMLIKRGVIE